jgi:hypothetical protein
VVVRIDFAAVVALEVVELITTIAYDSTGMSFIELIVFRVYLASAMLADKTHLLVRAIIWNGILFDFILFAHLVFPSCLRGIGGWLVPSPCTPIFL